MTQTRYDKLRNKINREFTRSTTLSPAFTAGERKTIFNIDDHNQNQELSNRFLKYGPFNAVTVQNVSSQDIRVYFGPERDTYITVPAGSNQARDVTTKVPKRYVRFLEIENLGTGQIQAGDVEINVGNEVDSVELTLLRDSGILDV